MKRIALFFTLIVSVLLTSCQVEEEPPFDVSGRTPVAIIGPRAEGAQARYDSEPLDCSIETDCAGYAVQEEIENPNSTRHTECGVRSMHMSPAGACLYGVVACSSGNVYQYTYCLGTVTLWLCNNGSC